MKCNVSKVTCCKALGVIMWPSCLRVLGFSPAMCSLADGFSGNKNTHITPQRVNREEDNKNNRSLVVSHQLWWQQRLIGLYQEEPWSTAALQTEQPHLSTSHGFHLHFHFLHMCMGSGTSLVFLNKAWLTIQCRSWKNSSYPAFL